MTESDADDVFTYHPGHPGLATETITIDPDGSGPLPSLTRTFTRSRDNLRRPTGFVLGNEHAVGYGYDVSGRLATLSAQGLPNLPGKSHAFEYTYEVGSSLLDKVTGPVHEVDNTYEPHRNVLLQKTNTRTVGTPAELSVIGYTVNAIGQREQRNLSGEIRTDFHGGQSTDLYTSDWGYDALSQVIVHYEYDSFGPSTRFVYRFSTKPRDPATGLYYYGFRWYDPYTGRWPSRDPLAETAFLWKAKNFGLLDSVYMDWLDSVINRNPYCFIGNQPSQIYDVLGLMPPGPNSTWGGWHPPLLPDRRSPSRGNCWRYACNDPTTGDEPHSPFPGGDQKDTVTCRQLLRLVLRSGGSRTDENGECPKCHYKILAVTEPIRQVLFIGEGIKLWNAYHFYGQDDNGTWSHKNGDTDVVSGVVDPEFDAKAQGFTNICGYLCIPQVGLDVDKPKP